MSVIWDESHKKDNEFLKALILKILLPWSGLFQIQCPKNCPKKIIKIGPKSQIGGGVEICIGYPEAARYPVQKS